MLETNARMSELKTFAQKEFSHSGDPGGRKGATLPLGFPPVWIMSTVLVVSGIAGMLFLSTNGLLNERAALKARGVDTTAYVVKKWTGMSCGRYSRCMKTYLIGYRFTVGAPKRLITDFRQTSQVDYGAAEVGGRVPVIYDPKSPSANDLNFNDQIRKLP